MESAAFDLLPDERMLWEGRPARHRLLRSADSLLIPFSIVWCGFVIFWESTALGLVGDQGAPGFFAIWGGLFVLIGLYFVAGRFVVRAISSRRARYAVTDRRVVTLGGVTGRRTTSAYLSSLPPPVIREQSDGSGSLAFGSFPGVTDTFRQRNGFAAWHGESSDAPVLWDVKQVRYVRDLVASRQAELRNPSGTT